jgi:hypothetical protein
MKKAGTELWCLRVTADFSVPGCNMWQYIATNYTKVRFQALAGHESISRFIFPHLLTSPFCVRGGMLGLTLSFYQQEGDPSTKNSHCSAPQPVRVPTHISSILLQFDKNVTFFRLCQHSSLYIYYIYTHTQNNKTERKSQAMKIF